jgi:hypothetical protein
MVCSHDKFVRARAMLDKMIAVASEDPGEELQVSCSGL